MSKNPTHYELLMVAKDATADAITAAWRTLMTKFRKHPDLGGSEAEAALINRARDVLLDPKQRSAYDASLETNRFAAKEDGMSERRRAPRHDIDATISFCLDHDLRWHPARVRDVSVLGVKIHTHAVLMTGQHVVIAPANLASAAIHGTVRWTRMFHPSVFERIYEAGVEFADQISDVDQRLSV